MPSSKDKKLDIPDLPVKIPQQYALVRVTDEYKDFLQNKKIYDCPLLKEDMFVFLGEIPNMKGHCVVAGHRSGKIVSGYHIENYVELTEEELWVKIDLG